MTKMPATRYKFFFSLLLGVFLVLILSGRATPYVMPAEQLLYLMGNTFSGFKTLAITQTTRLQNPYDQAEELILNEKIWLKNTGFYRSELIGEPYEREGEYNTIADREPGGDIVFRRLLMANDLGNLLTLLSRMGIDTESVAFTRHEGVVAYWLGHKDPRSPHLVVDKDTFLPVVFCYTLQKYFEPMAVTVRFGDYRKTGKGWYPYEITYSAGEVLEQSAILDLQVNAPVEQPLSEIMMEKATPGKFDRFQDIRKEDEQLQEIIELLKEKYQ